MSIISKPNTPEYIEKFDKIFNKLPKHREQMQRICNPQMLVHVQQGAPKKKLCQTCRSLNCNSNPCKALEEYNNVNKTSTI